MPKKKRGSAHLASVDRARDCFPVGKCSPEHNLVSPSLQRSPQSTGVDAGDAFSAFQAALARALTTESNVDRTSARTAWLEWRAAYLPDPAERAAVPECPKLLASLVGGR